MRISYSRVHGYASLIGIMELLILEVYKGSLANHFDERKTLIMLKRIIFNHAWRRMSKM